MNDCFLVLEPNNHMYKVIERAASQGIEVVAFHNLPLRAEGAYLAGYEAIAERIPVESWADPEILARIAEALRGRRLVGTYAAHESTLVLEAEIRESHGLPTLGPARLAELVTKPKVRARLRAAGLSRLRTFQPREVVAAGAWPIPGKACYLKPACGAGSVHVTRCHDMASFEEALEAWDGQKVPCRPILRLHFARGGDVFLEEEAPGELLSVEGFAHGGEYHLLGLTSRTVHARDPAVEMGATFPYLHPHRDAIVDKVRRIHRALDFHVGATHAEVVVSDDGDVELVELNVRFAGADILLLMNMVFSTPVETILLDLACGRIPDAHGVGAARRHACLQQVLPPFGTTRFESIEFPDGEIREKRTLKPLGSELATVTNQIDQLASFIVVAETYPEVLLQARRVRDRIRVNGQAIAGDPNNFVQLR